MTAHVVIGAGFGDEGKGLLTDFYVSNVDNPVVVRFNGGAQCSHTVVTPDNKRHIFSHFGSGTFLGAPTYFSEYMVVNPLLFCKEYEQLKFENPISLIDENCMITTPMDMMINQMIENHRNDKRHGSCGIGFGETIEREERGFHFRVTDLLNVSNTHRKLNYIYENYVPIRLNELGIYDIFFKKYDCIMKEILEQFKIDIQKFLSLVKISNLTLIKDRNLIFEGAQGLMLDMDFGEFPYVTRSRTGLYNVMQIVRQMDISSIEVNYITRSYATRHGAGPFNTEIEGLPYSKVVENTNVQNDWQGEFRFGYLNLSDIVNFVYSDIENARNFDANFNLTVSCLDQIDDRIIFSFLDEWFEGTEIEFFRTLKGQFPLFAIMGSYGPTRKDIIPCY